MCSAALDAHVLGHVPARSIVARFDGTPIDRARCDLRKDPLLGLTGRRRSLEHDFVAALPGDEGLDDVTCRIKPDRMPATQLRIVQADRRPRDELAGCR